MGFDVVDGVGVELCECEGFFDDCSVVVDVGC